MTVPFLVLHNFVHELLEVVHVPYLLSCQEVLFVFRHLEHNGCNGVPPFVKQILLVLLDVHELVHYMKLHIKLPAIDSVLSRIVEMVLDTASGEFVDLVESDVLLLLLWC